MTAEQQAFVSIEKSTKDVIQEKLFSKPCIMINKISFINFYEQVMFFKLADKTHEKALALTEVQLLDPSGKNPQ